ncbi:succinate-semialdehyde dehydrogenase [NADP(+)] GabD [Neocloeon triangulifer]|uniref:succinate-semialdehyde dehydrogenase [NADP(+)] GabD n=1 Tax=Neocloeon triangulifer TaxID=2078957 RepID=UPI00286EC1E4|nr:succinate-semialdehyde dehydrogenase [NADP(+)] GabD [Neocloeon triangulifer]
MINIIGKRSFLLVSRYSQHVRKMSLVKNLAFVNNKWVAATSGKTFEVTNPANGSVLGQVPDMDTQDTEEAIQVAYDAFQSWEFTTAKERALHLRNWFNLLEENKEEIAKIMTAESGKPLAEAAGEVAYGNGFIEWYSEEARRIHGEVISSPIHSKEMMLIRKPIGVAALITPWNFPIAMITRKAGAALAAGCTCVVKPAEDTPLTALAIAALAEKAGIPKGVFNVVTCSRRNAADVGKLLCQSPLVAGLSFTGSTNIGKLLYEQCASTVKRLSLELGGNAPFIVFESADLDAAVKGTMACKFRNCGQTCVSANRLFIQESIFDQFVSKLEETMRGLKVGDGAQPGVTQGPLINDAQASKVNDLVQDAIKKGAKVHLGGKPALDKGPRFFEPTLLTDVDHSMRMYHEEIFGPVAVCIPFKTEEEVLAIANGTRSGLAGYFFSNDLPQVWRVAKRLETGMVGINEGIISTPEAAFGGIKESGIGREGSHYGIEEYSYIKYLCFGNL